MFVIVRKNNVGIYGEIDRIEKRSYLTEKEALSHAEKLQSIYHESLTVAHEV